jgi:Ala-tRNA(Pro) deacylase
MERQFKMLDKKGTYELLEKYQLLYETHEHVPVYTIEELDALNLPHNEQIVKNLFLRDDKIRRKIIIWLQCQAIKQST